MESNIELIEVLEYAQGALLGLLTKGLARQILASNHVSLPGLPGCCLYTERKRHTQLKLRYALPSHKSVKGK